MTTAALTSQPLGSAAPPESVGHGIDTQVWSRARTQRLLRVALGLMWLIDGILQFQPYMFGKSFITGVILPNAVGQPSFIGAPITWIGHLVEPRVAVFNGFAATLQVLIGLGLLNRRTVKPALLASFAWALGIWFTGEGLGMIFTGTANPLTGAPGAALLYILVGAMCWPTVGVPRRSTKLGLIGARGARWAWAMLWLGSAMLWLLPANSSANATHDAIASVPSGAGWLTQVLNAAATATAGNGVVIATSAAVVSLAIGVTVLRDWHPKPFLWLAIAVSLAFWMIGQGFGGVFTGQATDVGTAPLVIAIAAILLARDNTASSVQGHHRHSETTPPRIAGSAPTPALRKRPAARRKYLAPPCAEVEQGARSHALALAYQDVTSELGCVSS